MRMCPHLSPPPSRSGARTFALVAARIRNAGASASQSLGGDLRLRMRIAARRFFVRRRRGCVFMDASRQPHDTMFARCLCFVRRALTAAHASQRGMSKGPGFPRHREPRAHARSHRQITRGAPAPQGSWRWKERGAGKQTVRAPKHSHVCGSHVRIGVTGGRSPEGALAPKGSCCRRDAAHDTSGVQDFSR